MNSTEELSKYSDNNSHYRSPTLARRATTELDSPQPEKPPKSKKWSLGGLFRRRKKEETESSTEEDLSPKKGFLQRRKQRKEDKRKKKINKAAGHFDHIVIPHQFTNGKEEESAGIFSDPSNGFNAKRTSSADRLTSRESLNKSRQESLSRASLGSGSLDSTGKKSRREKVKARVQAKRERMQGDSSSDEGSQRSTTSSITRFKSDDSLSKKEAASRKSRAARTERYNRRLTKEEETVLNKEAEQKTTVAEPKLVNRWVVVDEVTKSPPMRSKPLLGYSPSNPLPQKTYQNISTIPPVMRTSSNLSDSQRNYFNSSHKPANIYAPRNQNLQRSFQNKRDFNQEQRSYSYDCNINRSPTPVNEEEIIHVHFPIGKPIPKQRNPNLINNNIQHYSNQSLQRITPPPPPPRDPQRRMYPSVQYENTRPMSYAFENGQQRHSQPVDRTSSIRSYNLQNQPNQNQFGWQNNYRSNSEDHIAQAQSYHPVPLINRPASTTPDTPQQRYIRRHPNTDQYKYFAEKTPRSRKPIHIAPGPEQTYLSDSQVITRNNYKHPVHAASEFWKQKDLEEVKRKSQVIEPKIETKVTPVKKIEVKDVKKNFSVLSIPVKTADSLSSLSGQSETSPLPSFFDQTDARPLSMVLETQENHDLPKVKNPPVPPLRYSHQSPELTTENTWFNETEDAEQKKRRSSNLEDALDELEAIYKSLRLGDEDLLDRAERRDVPSVVVQKLLDAPHSRGAQSDSGFNYDLDCVDGLKQKRLRRSNVPDKVNDDMAYRRLNRDRPPPLDINAAMSNVSYILASPVLSGSVDENDNEANINNNEPDIMLDDVVYRNLKHMNNTLKIADPQLPFGIPVGPITGAANSDYLHAVPDNKTRSRFIPQKSPDIVKDDLAFRSLRKEGPITDDALNNNKPELGIKKKRAVRSISANVYNMMHRDVQKESESENEFEKAQSLTDIADAMEIARQILKDRQNKIYRKSAVSDSEAKPITSSLNKSNIPTSTETLTDTKLDMQQKLQVYIPLTTNEATLNQKPPLCPTPDRKPSKPATKESTPNRVSPAPDDISFDKSQLEDLLTKLAIEARETSEKLGNDLKLLDEEQSRKCSPRLSGTSSPAPEDNRAVILKSIDQKLSDIDAVSEHAKLCEKLLGCVVESTNLISHAIPEVKLQQVDEMNEPKIYKSVANVIVTRKPDTPDQNPIPEVHSESDHDYENILKDLKDDKCISPFEEHREQLMADFEVLKKDLFSDEFLKSSIDMCAQTPPNKDDGTFGKLQDETCSEGEVCSSTDVDCLASNLLPNIAECDVSNTSIIPPTVFNTTSNNSIYQHFSGPISRADSEHSSGFQSHGSSSADSSLNPVLDFEDSLQNSVLTVSNSDINYSVEVEINTLDSEGQIYNVPQEFADTTLLVNNTETKLHDFEMMSSIDHNLSSLEDLSTSLPYVSLNGTSEYPCSQIISPLSSSEDITFSLDSVDTSFLLDSLGNTSQNINISNSLVTSERLMNSTSMPFDSLDSASKLTDSQIGTSPSASDPSDFDSLPFEPLKSGNSSVDQSIPSSSSIACTSNRSEDSLDSATSWYKDPTTIALACSYSLAFAHQVAVLDLFTVLGLILAIVTVIAALIL